MHLATVHPCLTIGYSGLRIEDLGRFLEAVNGVLVDVRFHPFSRQEEWSRPALQRSFSSRYVWCRPFGNVAFRSITAPVQLADPERGLEIVRAILRVRPVVLLCLEPNPQDCHRSEVAQLLHQATGCMIKHLRSHEIRSAGQLDLLPTKP
jgi:uncharacterized protein (DUF488 family)